MSISLVFSFSPERYKKLTEIKSEMLLLTHRKLKVVDNIYQLNNKVANISPDGKPLENNQNSKPPYTRQLEYNRRLLIEEIKKNEQELDYIDKRILALNHDIRLCIGRN